MKLLVTGAWHCSSEQLKQIESLGHTIVFMQNEQDDLPCDYEQVEGVICTGAKQNKFAMLQYAKEFKSRYEQKSASNIRRVNERLAKQGKKLTEGQKSQVMLGAAKSVWKSHNVEKAGYEYIEIKKARW